MYRKTMKRRRNRKAFTLLEILLVVGLLAMLAAVAVPALIGQAEKARITAAEAALGSAATIPSQIRLYKFNIGSYPEELEGLIKKPDDDEIAEKWTGPYLEGAQGLKDPWGNDYQYDAEGKHNEGSFDLWSNGPDGEEGTEDDITNWEDDR